MPLDERVNQLAARLTRRKELEIMRAVAPDSPRVLAAEVVDSGWRTGIRRKSRPGNE